MSHMHTLGLKWVREWRAGRLVGGCAGRCASTYVGGWVGKVRRVGR